MPYAINAHADDSAIRMVHLYEWIVAGTLRWTDNEVPVYWNGHTWQPYVVTASGIATDQGGSATATLEIGNADNLGSAILFAGDVTGTLLNIYQAWFDPAAPGQVPAEVRQVLVARVTDPEIDRTADGQSIVRLTVGPVSDPQTKMFPRRTVASLMRV